jgi:hypothetical protein
MLRPGTQQADHHDPHVAVRLSTPPKRDAVQTRDSSAPQLANHLVKSPRQTRAPPMLGQVRPSTLSTPPTIANLGSCLPIIAPWARTHRHRFADTCAQSSFLAVIRAISIGAADFEVLLRGRVRNVPVRFQIRDVLSFLGFHSPPRSAPLRLVLPSPAGGPRGSTSRDARRDRALRGESREARSTKSPLPLVFAPESDDFERGLFGVWRGGAFDRASPTAGIHRPS